MKLDIRSDNISAVTLLSKLKAGSPKMNFLARVWAVVLALEPYRPDITAHIPGVSAVTVDALSRRHAPGSSWSTPAELLKVREVTVPKRGTDFWGLPVPNFVVAEPTSNKKDDEGEEGEREPDENEDEKPPQFQ